MEPVVWLVAGFIGGWLCGVVMKGKGYGLVGDVVVGALGVLVGVWSFGFAVPDAQGQQLAGWIVAGLVGAILFVVMARALTRRAVQA